MPKVNNDNDEVIVELDETKYFTKEELKQWEKDALLDGPPGTIPNWSTQYKKQKEENKSDK